MPIVFFGYHLTPPVGENDLLLEQHDVHIGRIHVNALLRHYWRLRIAYLLLGDLVTEPLRSKRDLVAVRRIQEYIQVHILVRACGASSGHRWAKDARRIRAVNGEVGLRGAQFVQSIRGSPRLLELETVSCEASRLARIPREDLDHHVDERFHSRRFALTDVRRSDPPVPAPRLPFPHPYECRLLSTELMKVCTTPTKKISGMPWEIEVAFSNTSKGYTIVFAKQGRTCSAAAEFTRSMHNMCMAVLSSVTKPARLETDANVGSVARKAWQSWPARKTANRLPTSLSSTSCPNSFLRKMGAGCWSRVDPPDDATSAVAAHKDLVFRAAA
jgi:hypothetical protein